MVIQIVLDKVANAIGMSDTHDGVNFVRAACVTSLEKARDTFDQHSRLLEFECFT